MSEATLSEFVLQQFLTILEEEELRRQVRMKSPATLDEAMRYAVMLEALEQVDLMKSAAGEKITCVATASAIPSSRRMDDLSDTSRMTMMRRSDMLRHGCDEGPLPPLWAGGLVGCSARLIN